MLSSFLRLQADAIKAITAAAGVEVEPYWPALFEKFLAGKDIGEMLSNVGSGAGAPAAAEVSKEGLGLGKAEIGRVVLSPSWSLSSLSALVFVWPFVVYRPSRKGRVV